MTKNKYTMGLIALAVTLLALRLALEPFVLWYVNRTLNRIPEYEGSIEDVDISLFRGAYTIKGARLTKTGGKVPVPLFESRITDLSVEWKALLEGKFVGEIALERGMLNFVKGRLERDSQLSVDSEWLDVVKDLFPLRFNRFSLREFEVHYRDPYSSPPVDVTINDIRLEGTNFSNTRRPVDATEANIMAIGLLEKKAPMRVKAVVAPSRQRPTFQLDGSLERLPLPRLNDLFKAYGNFDVEKGSARFYLSMNANNGHIKGTLKPLIQDIEVFEPEEDDESLLSGLWESLIGVAAELFENQRQDQIGSIIPFESNEDRIRSDNWTAVVEMLRNAFFEALAPGLTEKEKSKS